MVGLAGLILVSALKLAIAPVFTSSFNGLFFSLAILFAAGMGGMAPGVFTTVLALPLVYFFTDENSTSQGPDMALFAGVGFGIAWLGGVLREERNKAIMATRLLQRRENYLQAILDTISDATIATKPSGEIVSFNAAAERLFGYREKVVLTRNVNILLTEPRQPDRGGGTERAPTGFARLMGGSRLLRGKRSDGTTFPMSIHVARIATSEGPLFIGFARDMTERERAATRLEQTEAELARLSRMSEMGEMASALAHEINQPLSAVSNYVQGAKRMLEVFDPAMLPALRESLAATATQALRAGDIIHHLRIFMAQGEIDKEIVDINTLIEGAMALALAGTREDGILTELDLAPGPLEALGNPTQIQQVIVNLLRNAADAVRASERKVITVRTRRSGKFVRVELSDTGHGIPPDFGDEIFKAFVTTKRSGMGVGLSISRRIIEGHGGAISARTIPGRETIFTFTLPLVDREIQAHDQ
ncbi:ATP-binding protein [Pelagibacterium halotolerans]|nr:ATP-binding protein [Pelagibacterium halotolerans]QJR17722.1 PAS domain S-box protein [Pelagibacterium halotolerans]